MATQPASTSRAIEGARVLVASENAQLRHQLAADLIEHGLWLTAARSESAILEELAQQDVDLLVLDWHDGRAPLIEAIRRESSTPVIALVHSDDGEAALRAFDAGVDDSVTWPWDVREFARRIEAMLRRSRPEGRKSDVIDGPAGVRLYARAHEVLVNGEPIDLTPKEFLVLQLLLERRGEVLTADDLSSTLWGHETFGARNFVEAHVSRLRAKLRAVGVSDAITTIRGVGYKIR